MVTHSSLIILQSVYSEVCQVSSSYPRFLRLTSSKVSPDWLWAQSKWWVWHLYTSNNHAFLFWFAPLAEGSQDTSLHPLMYGIILHISLPGNLAAKSLLRQLQILLWVTISNYIYTYIYVNFPMTLDILGF